MPVRTGKVAPKKAEPVAKVEEVKKTTPTRKVPTRKEPVEEEVTKKVATRPARTTPKVEEKDEVDEEGKTIKKSILEEHVKKFITKVAPDLLDKVNDVFERAITDTSTGEKNNILFLAFSDNGTDDDEVNDEFNIECIKTLLFAYHTDEEKPTKGKVLFAEVMPPKEAGSPHILCFQEVSTV